MLTTKIGFKGLVVYQKADELVINTYTATRNFPKEEIFALTSQMRRAAISVVANIVEGYARETFKDKARFYYIARGSLQELEYYLDLSLKLNFINQNQFDNLGRLRQETARLLHGLIKATVAKNL